MRRKIDPDIAIWSEFVCDRCLRSCSASDLACWPRCARCGIRMTQDISEPMPRKASAPRVTKPQTPPRPRARPREGAAV